MTRLLRLTLTALAGLLAVSAANAANAADLPIKAPIFKAPAAIEAWGGFYVGAGLGFRASESSVNVNSATDTTAPLVLQNMTLTGSTLAMLGGGYAFAQSQPRLRIDPTEFQPIPIAISNFVPGSPSDGDVGNGVTQVITNNLKRSGLFAPIDQAAFIERISNIDVAPQFQNWKTINAQALVTGRMKGRRNSARSKPSWPRSIGPSPLIGRQAAVHPQMAVRS